MTFMPPNSSAMDATAGSGGPITFLPQIVTGSPEQIATHVTGLLGKAEQFLQLVEQFDSARTQLEQSWSGSASDSASAKIRASLQSFEKIIKVVQEGAQLLGVSGTLVQTAQTAYQTVVSATNPTVASLMSNPWTYSAAVALSTATSSSLRMFITGVEGMLQAIGAGQLATQIATLVQVIDEVEQLAGGSSTGSTPTTATLTDATMSATPVLAPGLPASVATEAGRQVAASLSSGSLPAGSAGAGTPALTDYIPAALAGLGAGTGVPATASYPASAASLPIASVPIASVPTAALPAAAQPTGADPAGSLTAPDYRSLSGATSLNPADSWIATDPSAAIASQPQPLATDAGAGMAPGGSGDITLHAQDAGMSSTVEVPAGHDVDVTLDVTMDGHTLHEHGHIAADGTVST